MKNLFIIAGFSAGIAISGCGSESTQNHNSTKPITITVSKAAEETSSGGVLASGKVEAINSATISTRMMGYVTSVHVKTGQSVSKGTLLVSISGADLHAKKAQVDAGIEGATAAFNNAQKDFIRYTALFQQQSASQKELDDMTANYEMAKSHLETARQLKNEINAQFSYTEIRAPFSGVVTNTFVKEGDMANPGMPLMAIETPNQIEIAAMVAESDIGSIKEGMGANIVIKSTGSKLTGKVREVSLSARNTGGQYIVKILPDVKDVRILPGMFVNIQFEATMKGGSVHASAIFLPDSVLVHEGQLTGVYTVSEEKTAVLRWLRTGIAIGGKTEVLSGLEKGELYISSASGRLYNGIPVVIQ